MTCQWDSPLQSWQKWPVPTQRSRPSFRVTDADLAIGRLFDREVILGRMDSKQKRIAESQRRYYEAHKEEIAEGKRELRDARIALGLTQKQAAELLGVAQSTVCYWETISPPKNWREMIEKLTEPA